MTPEDKRASPERDETDESLRTERQKTDQALLAKQQLIEKDADEVVDHAREVADAVLSEARDKADQKLEEEESPPGTRETVGEERALEDAALQSERVAADESLRLEREEHARALHRLLPLEREKTDRHLLTERARSDFAISNRDDFLGIVSHDLRNLLQGIIVSAELLTARAADDEGGQQTRAGVKRIERYAARMVRLIGDLVDVTSIDAGKLSVTPRRQDLCELVAEAMATFEPVASAKGISLGSESAEPCVLMDFDHDRMMQVFANLLANAIKFTPEGGKVSIRVEPAEDRVLCCVSDTGTGIPGNMLELVFERFWQVGSDDRRGLGLGLYISRCIVEAHGGTIWAESRMGEGSRLCFTLPRSSG
ncbi:MAG TPA: ATP-binding protein [Thermoanaerobaculia bacterium]|jgi:signal transduction histidine kinase|nr:ATP-binding protein [Thermoanaerobaculia bacterium]